MKLSKEKLKSLSMESEKQVTLKLKKVSSRLGDYGTRC
jgi:activator of HSP90 ATPase